MSPNENQLMILVAVCQSALSHFAVLKRKCKCVAHVPPSEMLPDGALPESIFLSCCLLMLFSKLRMLDIVRCLGFMAMRDGSSDLLSRALLEA